MKFTPIRALIFTALSVLLWGCDHGGGTDPEPGFDRGPMLENYADKLIIPAYQALAVESQVLLEQVEQFTADPQANGLSSLRQQWRETIESFQYAAIFSFGPAETAFGVIYENLGTWPVDTSLLLDFIIQGDSSLSNFDRDTRGLLGMEYLLFGGSDEQVLSSFADPSRAAYLRAVARDIHEEATRIQNAWAGDYRSTFVESVGTSAGSSTSLLYNNFVLGFERLKNFKLGLPLGLRPGQVSTEPQLVEARYSHISLDLLKLHLDAVEQTYYGRELYVSALRDGQGFDDYLQTISGGPALLASTQEQLAAVKEVLAQVPTDRSLADLIAEEHTSVLNLHTALQRLTRFFKSDMSSLLGISITFDSGDGD